MHDGTMTIGGICRLCQKMVKFTVPEEGYKAWRNGVLIQRAMPTLSVNDREFLISRTCGKCFDDLFSGDEMMRPK